MNRKGLIIIILLFIVIVGAYLIINKDKTSQGQMNTSNSDGQNFLLEGYPIDEVPLYKADEISSTKYFVNKDPLSFEDYFGKPVNYYNIVYNTEASQSEVLQYYRSLMSEENDEYPSESKVEGKIGKYKVAASHYGSGAAYLQVYLPQDEYQEENPYFENYPNLVDLDSWPEHESSYGLLNQNGGEIEYTQYFPLAQEEADSLYQEYKEKYSSKTNFTSDDSQGMLIWEDDGYTFTMTFSQEHGRTYLMIRRSL